MKRMFLGLVFLVVSTIAIAGRVESWFYVIDDDPLDDSPTTKLGSPAEEGVGRMVVFCEGMFVEMIAVDWQSYIGSEANTLKYRFDDGPVVLEEAVISTSGQAVIFEEHDVFDEMQKHDKLYIRGQVGDHAVTDTLTIDLSGLKELLEQTYPDCSVTL